MFASGHKINWDTCWWCEVINIRVSFISLEPKNILNSSHLGSSCLHALYIKVSGVEDVFDSFSFVLGSQTSG